jgi:cell division protein FtsB
MSASGLVWLRRLGIATALAVALGYGPYHIYGKTGLARYLRLKSERDQLHAANLRLAEENRQLRIELSAISDVDDRATSLQAIERAARDDGLVKPGEIVFHVEERR